MSVALACDTCGRTVYWCRCQRTGSVATMLRPTTLIGCDVVDSGDGIVVLMDGRRRVGMIVDDGEGTHTAWVYVFDRSTGNTLARFVGRAQTREAAADRIQAARPARTSWT